MKAGRRVKKGLAIGLTGGIACGKTEVGRLLEREGAEVCDADAVAHDLIRAGQPLFDRVVERFGPGIVGRDGEIDRQALGRIVFADAGERAALEKIVHPDVIGVLREWRDEVVGRGRHAVAVIPLLFEVGLDALWDATVCVTAPDGAVAERLKARGLTADEARSRIAAQMPVERKAEKADYVIRNEGTLKDLARETRNVWERLLKEEK